MSSIELKVPDIGDFDEVEVIELLVQPGSVVQLEQSLITVESEKASMEIPASTAGRITELRIKLGDKVREGSVIALIEPIEAGAAPTAAAPQAPASQRDLGAPQASAAPQAGATPDGAAAPVAAAAPGVEAGQATPAIEQNAPPPLAQAPTVGALRQPPLTLEPGEASAVVKPHASPSVRKFARELGVDLVQVRATGPKQRITPEDVRSHVKAVMSAQSATGTATTPGAERSDAGASLGLLPWPKVDFARFGPIEHRPLPRIRRISAANLHRNWVMIPHVTHHEEADVTDLEAFRVALNTELASGGAKLTMLAFLVKACVHALKQFPEFNASLEGEQLVIKQYWHIGFAADTPNGLVVPVIRDADRKGLGEIATETASLARLARDGKLSPAQMQGGTFSISSLGGIGGTGFTPIINAPEVAILGVNRSVTRPVWSGQSFVPRLMLPLSLSYDHRVIDGAAAARFCAHLARLLSDFRRVSI